MLVTGDVGDGMLVTNFMYVRDESIFVTKKNVGDDAHMLVTNSMLVTNKKYVGDEQTVCW